MSPPQPGPMIDGVAAPDLRDVKGQEGAKRALEIAAAGGHNLLFVGPPGSGKSMLAQRLPGLLPPLSPTELLETSMVHSVAGLIAKGALTWARPFRSPHHSASMAALTGGGIRAKPGEVSLAHNGVLFLDELPEFASQALDSLRAPLETGEVLVARANFHIRYPARVQLVAAMNPCKCGHAGLGRALLWPCAPLHPVLSEPGLGTLDGPDRSADRGSAGHRHRSGHAAAGRGHGRGGRPRAAQARALQRGGTRRPSSAKACPPSMPVDRRLHASTKPPHWT